jgi:hypothetical protein
MVEEEVQGLVGLIDSEVDLMREDVWHTGYQVE